VAVVNITTQNDADFYRTFAWQTIQGAPINLGGMLMEMMLRRHASDVASVLRLGSDTGEIVFLDMGAGKFSVRIPQATLERLGLGDFDHSCIVTRNGYKVRVWSGLLTNNAGATR
jgi:hypothetical protein